MSEEQLPHQSISHISVQQGSRAYIGSFSNCAFRDTEEPEKASEQVAAECRNALFLTDPHVDRERLISAKGTRVAGTCEWITRNKSYLAWLNNGGNGDGDGDGSNNHNTRLLWISGGPGKGKTMLSVFLTEELERYTAGREDTQLAFFFCSAEDEKRNTAVAVLRGLVHQIIAWRPQLVKHALPYFETPERRKQTLSSLETLWLIFSILIADAEFRTMFCVLDGLDECEESTLRVLLPRIVSLLTGESSSSTKGTLKLAIVSRDLPGLRGCTTRVRLDPDNDEQVVGDIELFVSAQVRELSRIEGFNEDFRASVQTTLLERAEATFLWVGFAMHELSQKETCSEIWEALEDLPSGLPAIYSRMLLHIPAKRREVSRAILRWVTLAARPLQLQELAAATDVRPSSRLTIDQATRDAIALCGPLLKVQEREVSLVHQSARDYLLRKECDSNAVLEAFRLRIEPSHLELAHKCLDCIAQSSLQHQVIDLDAELGSEESPLLQYATLYWPEHARSCSALAAELFSLSAAFFQKKSSLRMYWWETYERKRDFWSIPVPSLHMACSLEIVPWVKAVLAKKSWRPRYRRRVNKKDRRGETALHYAASRGNEVLVRLLVDKGANLKMKDNSDNTVLHSATSAGEVKELVVRLLMKSGADIKAKNKNGMTVLHWAAVRENEAVMRTLLDSGADLKMKNNDGKTALHLAVGAGSEAVVRLLVDSGADVKAKANNGRTVLHSAVSFLRQSEAVVRLLMDKGADVKAKDNDGKTVLHLASMNENVAIVQLLIERGADVKAEDNNGKTALDLARLAWFGNNEAVVGVLVITERMLRRKTTMER